MDARSRIKGETCRYEHLLSDLITLLICIGVRRGLLTVSIHHWCEQPNQTDVEEPTGLAVCADGR